MKKTILLPLFLGLVLAGCTRTNSDSKKVSANDQSDPNKPTYEDQAITARKDTTKDQSQVASTPTPAPAPSTEATMPTPDSSSAVATTPAATPSTSTPAVTDPSTTPISPAPAATDIASTSTEAKPDLTARITEWKLSATEIKTEVEAGRVVRTKVPGAGEPTGPMDDLLISQIKSKLQENSDTSSLQLEISADKGVVTLAGTASSLDQIGKAIALSLDTPGVTQTVSEVKLEPAR